MGYAVFTARKLMLTNRINQMNFRLLQLSQQQQTLSDLAGQMERAAASRNSLFSNITNMFNSGMQQMQNESMYRLSMQNFSQGGTGDISALGSIFSMFGGSIMNNPFTVTMNFIQQQQQIISENNIRQVKDQENQIELQRKSIDTQLAAAQKELEKVEEAEQKNIDRSAPKFA